MGLLSIRPEFEYGNQELSYDLNKNILKLTLRFIHESGRFDSGSR